MNAQPKTVRLTILIFLVFGLILASTGCGKLQEVSANQARAENQAHGKLGDTLTLDGFRKTFNLLSDRKIGPIQVLKDNKVLTSHLYTFDKDLAISFITDNSTDLLIKAILVGTDSSEFQEMMEQVIRTVDPGLNLDDQQAIISKVQKGQFQEEEVYAVKNNILYKLKSAGDYLQFTVEKDE